MTASASADLELMRGSMLLELDPAAAARHASNVLANSPGHEQANLLLAAASRRLGDPTTATRVLESLARTHPSSAVMQLELGRAYVAAGRQPEAFAAFKAAVGLDEALGDGWRELAAQHFLAGETQLGDAAYLKYSRLTQDPPELTDAHVALSAGRLDAAEAMAQRQLNRMPREVAALRLLAEVAARRWDRAEAERYLTQSLEIAPGDAAARHELARLLYRQERVAEALPLIERLLATEPRNTSYISLKAQSLRLIGRVTDAIALMEGVVEDFPQDAQAWLVFGNLMREVGEQRRSIEAFRRALGAQPAFGEAYWALANLKTFRFTEADIESMQRQLEQSSATGTGRMHLEFALGKALEDAEQFAMSFEHYAHGAALQRAAIPYDAAATSEFVRRSKATYSAEFFADRNGWGESGQGPIFIVGLPRSGSTLLEQILASHSQIEGTRELPEMPAIAMNLFSSGNPGGLEYPESVALLSKAGINDCAARYLAGTLIHRPLGLPYFVDKMLGNFSHLGLIQLMFPHAAIIDARRQPLACCFSCFKQLFAQGMNYSYDLGELGGYYRDYVEMMQHIDTVLPGRVHRVHYEQLVADPEHEVRRLLEYCGLPFEEECLRFYDNPRAVHTISSEQVRRPIYSDAVDQWRNYEPWLKPLKDALGDLVERYPRS